MAKEADVNAKYECGNRPLHYASQIGNKEIVKLLIDYGANINAQTDFAQTPLHWAAKWNRADIVDLLLKAGLDINIKDFHFKTAADETKTEEIKDVINSYENYMPILKR